MHVGGDAPGDVFLQQPGGDMDGVGDALVVGAAVAFHHHAIQAQHYAAIMVVGVQMMAQQVHGGRSEEHTSELKSLMHTLDVVFCLQKKTTTTAIRLKMI